jgi:hypothetical protein
VSNIHVRYCDPECGKQLFASNDPCYETRSVQALLSIIHRLQEHQFTAIFRQPVNPETNPGYYDVVTDPVDLETVESVRQ